MFIFYRYGTQRVKNVIFSIDYLNSSLSKKFNLLYLWELPLYIAQDVLIIP